MLATTQNEQLNAPEKTFGRTSANSFELSVIQAAQKQAAQILENAKLESEKLYAAILSQDNGDPVKAHETELNSLLRKSVANIKQDNLKKLIIYRKQLVNGLFAECSEQLLDFTNTKEYTPFLQNSLAPYMQCANEQGADCIVLLRQNDKKGENIIKKLLPQAKIKSDAQIKIGGAKITCGRILFDETLDTRLSEYRKEFLVHCELHIDAIGLEQSDE